MTTNTNIIERIQKAIPNIVINEHPITHSVEFFGSIPETDHRNKPFSFAFLSRGPKRLSDGAQSDHVASRTTRGIDYHPEIDPILRNAQRVCSYAAYDFEKEFREIYAIFPDDNIEQAVEEYFFLCRVLDQAIADWKKEHQLL